MKRKMTSLLLFLPLLALLSPIQSMAQSRCSGSLRRGRNGVSLGGVPLNPLGSSGLGVAGAPLGLFGGSVLGLGRTPVGSFSAVNAPL